MLCPHPHSSAPTSGGRSRPTRMDTESTMSAPISSLLRKSTARFRRAPDAAFTTRSLSWVRRSAMAESPFSWRSAERMYRPYWGERQGPRCSLGRHSPPGTPRQPCHPPSSRELRALAAPVAGQTAKVPSLCQCPPAGQASKISQLHQENAGQGAAERPQTFIPAPAHRGKEWQGATEPFRAWESPHLS